MASRYYDAFRNFGGLCLVDRAYEVGENFTQGRSTAWQTVEFIDSLCQCAINEPGYIWNIPDADVGQWSGRLTKASARALRAKVWMFAASPLFNSAAPYITYDKKPTGLEDEHHVWFGKEDPTLWQRCLQYCNDFFTDNEANGNYYQLIQPDCHSHFHLCCQRCDSVLHLNCPELHAASRHVYAAHGFAIDRDVVIVGVCEDCRVRESLCLRAK